MPLHRKLCCHRVHTRLALAAVALCFCACSDGGGNVTTDAFAVPTDAGNFDANVSQTDIGSAAVDSSTESGDTVLADTADNSDAANATVDSGPLDDANTPSEDASEPVEDGTATPEDAQSESDADIEDLGLVLVPVNPAGEVSAVVTSLGKHKATFVRALGDSVLFGAPKGPVLWHPDIDNMVEISGTKGTLVDAVQLGKVVLIATTNDLYAVTGKEAKSSPLGAAIASKGKPPVISQMLVVPGKTPDLWLLGGGKLHLYRAGKLHKVAVKGLDLSDGRMAWGPKVNGKAALWVAAGLKIAGIVVDAGKVQAWVEITDRSATAIGADSKGRLFVASDGACLRRDADGLWQGWTFAKPMTSLVASQETKEVFLKAGDAYFVHIGDDFHTLTEVPKISHWAPDKGRALIATVGQISRLQTTPPVAKPKVSWSKHVKPIYENSCSLCHSAKGVNTKLYEASQWQMKYKVLWGLVSSGGMPLKPNDPLTPAELSVIKNWKKDGFLN